MFNPSWTQLVLILEIMLFVLALIWLALAYSHDYRDQRNYQERIMQEDKKKS